MTTAEFLQREIRRTELSVRRAERKPNTPPEELRGLREKKAADVRPVVRGRWRWVGQDQWNDCYECSQCGKMNTDNSNFCPNCGADMRGGTDQ